MIRVIINPFEDGGRGRRPRGVAELESRRGGGDGGQQKASPRGVVAARPLYRTMDERLPALHRSVRRRGLQVHLNRILPPPR